MDDKTIDVITRKVLQKLSGGETRGLKFPVGVSARHVHLSREHLEILFGKGYELQVYKMLRQPDQYAAREKLAIVGPRSALYGVRILGPTRGATQVEISRTDCFKLGLDAPVRDSGHHDGTGGAILVGPKGLVQLERGVIVAARHLHIEPARAEEIGLKDQDRVKIRVDGERALVFANVLVRCGTAHLAEFHLDTDEANASGLCSGDEVEVLI